MGRKISNRIVRYAVFFAGERNSSILRSHFMSVAKAKASSGLINTVSFGPG